MDFKHFEVFLQILTATISAYLFLQVRKNRFMLLLTLLLICSAITESIGAYLLLRKIDSYIYYYLYTFFQFNIVSCIYYLLVKKELWRKTIIILSFIFSLFWSVVYFNRSMFFYLIIFGAFNTSLYIFFYLKELLLSDKILRYSKILPFWVSVGFLVFYLPSIPFFTFWRYLKGRNLFFILKALIILMNIFIIYGLLCSKKEKY